MKVIKVLVGSRNKVICDDFWYVLGNGGGVGWRGFFWRKGRKIIFLLGY